jgi:hypothetical protein
VIDALVAMDLMIYRSVAGINPTEVPIPRIALDWNPKRRKHTP